MGAKKNKKKRYSINQEISYITRDSLIALMILLFMMLLSHKDILLQ